VVWHAIPAACALRPAVQGDQRVGALVSRDLFDALHLSAPTTWSEWLALNDTLIRRGIAPLASVAATAGR